jgi:hypothetical protein
MSGGGISADALRAELTDSAFAPFLSSDFDPDRFAGDVMVQETLASNADGEIKSGTTLTAEEVVEGLNNNVARVDTTLKGHVTTHHEDLLSKVGTVRELSQTTEAVHSDVSGLRSSMNRIKREMIVPYTEMQRRTVQLKRMQVASDLLRRVLRLIYATRKLRKQMAALPTQDSDQSAPADARVLSLAAQSLYDIENSMREADMTGIDVVDAEVEWIGQAGGIIRSQSLRALQNGITSLNQAELGSVLQVFFNLHCLPQQCDEAVQFVVESVVQDTKAALDPSVLPAIDTQGSAWQTALWSRCEKVVDAVHTHSVEVWHLQRVLAKKRDPITHMCFIECVVKPGEPTIFHAFWKQMCKRLKLELLNVMNTSAAIKDGLVQAYPRLRQAMGRVLDRLARSTERNQEKSINVMVGGTGRPLAGGAATVVDAAMERVGDSAGEKDELQSALSPIMRLHLERITNRLSEPVAQMFPSSGSYRNSPPSKNDVKAFVGNVATELRQTTFDTDFVVDAGNSAAKSIQLFATKAHQQVQNDKNAFHFDSKTWKRNPTQEHNGIVHTNDALPMSTSSHSLCL